MADPLVLRLTDPQDRSSELRFNYNDTGTFIIWHKEGRWNIVKQTKKSGAPALSQLAFSKGTVYLETHTTNTCVRPLSVNGACHDFPLPKSTAKATRGVYLRVGDQVIFGDDNVKLELVNGLEAGAIDTPHEVTTPPAHTIEVRSSDPDLRAIHDQEPNTSPAENHASVAPMFSTAHEIIEETPNGKAMSLLLPGTSIEEDVSGIVSSPSVHVQESIAQPGTADPLQPAEALVVDANSLVQEATPPVKDFMDIDPPVKDTTPIGSDAPTESSSEQTPRPEDKPTTLRPRSTKRKSTPQQDASTPEARRSSKRHRPDDSPASSSKHDDAYPGPDNPSILYSSTDITSRPALMKFMKSKSTPTDNIADADYLCVGSGPLKTTLKLLASLIAKRPIVTDKWVVASSRAGTLVDPAPFVPAELLAAAAGGGSGLLAPPDRTSLFAARTVVFTPAVRRVYGRGMRDVETIIAQAGGRTAEFRELLGRLSSGTAGVDAGVDADAGVDVDVDVEVALDGYLVIGEDEGDPGAKKALGKGLAVYRRDLVSASVLQGRLVVDELGMRVQGSSSA